VYTDCVGDKRFLVHVTAKQLEQQADLVLLMENPRGSEHNGIGDSLARGIRQAMCAEWDAALIALGDMPWVRENQATCSGDLIPRSLH